MANTKRYSASDQWLCPAALPEKGYHDFRLTEPDFHALEAVRKRNGKLEFTADQRLAYEDALQAAHLIFSQDAVSSLAKDVWPNLKAVLVAAESLSSALSGLNSALDERTSSKRDVRARAAAGATMLAVTGDKFDFSGWVTSLADLCDVIRRCKAEYGTGQSKSKQADLNFRELIIRLSILYERISGERLPKEWVSRSTEITGARSGHARQAGAPCGHFYEFVRLSLAHLRHVAPPINAEQLAYRIKQASRYRREWDTKASAPHSKSATTGGRKITLFQE
jgi:hypothetical protein